MSTTTPNASGARSINPDDLERIGYTVERVGTRGANAKTYTTDGDGYTIKDDNTSSTYTFTYWDEHTESGTATWKSLGAGESVTLGNYIKTIGKPSGNAVTSRAEKMVIKKSNGSTSASYWLASRSLDFFSGFVYFRARLVKSDWVYSGNTLYYSTGSAWDYGYAVRPAVYLQSNIQLTFNGDTESPAYTISTGS